MGCRRTLAPRPQLHGTHIGVWDLPSRFQTPLFLAHFLPGVAAFARMRVWLLTIV
jgi:hypothetical protein